MAEFNWISLIFFSIILLATPGPAVISLLYSGINYGFMKSLPFFFGILLGFAFNLLISAFSAGALLDFTLVYDTLKYAMLAYILYLSYKIATSTPLDADGDTKPLNFYQGVLLNLLNPKAYVASLSAISQFSIVDEYVYSTAFVIIINIAVAFVFQGAWCFAGQYLKNLFSHPKWYRPLNILLAVMLTLSVILANAL